MNDQVVVLIRYAITALVGYGVGKGWFTPAQATDLTAVLINLAVAAVGAIPTIIGVIKTSKTSKVAAVQAMPDMQVATTNAAVAAAVPDVKLASPSAATITVPVPKPAS
jgi:methyl coenzyme M reductase alpha subunit